MRAFDKSSIHWPTRSRTWRTVATKQSIQDDLEKALDLLKSMASEEERERATVYMEGLAQMRREWRGKRKKAP